MHELALAQNIMNLINEEQTRHNFTKVETIKLSAGGFCGIDPHALSFAFEIVRAGSCAAEAELDLQIDPIKITCRQCGFSASVEHGVSICPQCKSSEIMWDGDSHFDIVSLEVE